MGKVNKGVNMKKTLYLILLIVLTSCSSTFWTTLETSTQYHQPSRLCSYWDPYYGIVRYTYCNTYTSYYTYPTYLVPTYYNRPTVVVVKENPKPKPKTYTPTPPRDDRRTTGVDRSKPKQSNPPTNKNSRGTVQRDVSKGEPKVRENRNDNKN